MKKKMVIFFFLKKLTGFDKLSTSLILSLLLQRMSYLDYKIEITCDISKISLAFNIYRHKIQYINRVSIYNL